MELTKTQFAEVKKICFDIFEKKYDDYGTAWRIMRAESITDQIFIKAQRIKSIEQKGVAKVNEGIVSEFIAIVNYGIMGLIQLELSSDAPIEMEKTVTMNLYQKYYDAATALMLDKNHDYGEAWRNMRTSSYTDLILMKIHRTKQIEDNNGVTKISEGVDANYYDMINYAIFALIKLVIEKETQN
ncbi:MAG: DUF1599 domain-containing protein [Bacteroidales bacterium]|jgi:hypothetical protein|nr:DUF1599 domain-containing protein [Bacteroidales bacterium]